MGDLEISTIDSFQGKEKDLIILSLVKKPSIYKNKFLSCDQRCNVALTRAKYNLFIIGDINAYNQQNVDNWKDLGKFARDKGLVVDYQTVSAVMKSNT